MLAFMLAYIGKLAPAVRALHDGSGMEYVSVQDGFFEELIRLVTAIMGIVTTVGMLAFLVRGATLFMGMIFPVDPSG